MRCLVNYGECAITSTCDSWRLRVGTDIFSEANSIHPQNSNRYSFLSSSNTTFDENEILSITLQSQVFLLMTGIKIKNYRFHKQCLMIKTESPCVPLHVPAIKTKIERLQISYVPRIDAPLIIREIELAITIKRKLNYKLETSARKLQHSVM